MRLFRDLPIRQKLTWAIGLTTAMALLLASIGFVVYEVYTFRAAMVDLLSSQAEIVAYNCTSALEFEDQKAAATTLASLRSEERITGAAIYRTDGSLFARYLHAVPQLSTDDRIGHEIRDGTLYMTKPILSENKLVGSIRIMLDMSEMYTSLRRYLTIATMVFLAAMLLSLPIISRVREAIDGPISHLVATARKISEHRDYSVRATATSSDELGVLVQTFNEMLTQIQERDMELKRARDQAEEASRSKDEFLAVVSHELRTPLTPIAIWARLLREEVTDPTAIEALDTIERSVKTQTRLIDDLLDVSRVIAGKLRLDVQTVALQEIVGAAIDSARPAAEAKGITIDWKFDSRGVSISGDPARLQQIVWNLVSNAIKFTPPGGIVSVTVDQSDSIARITVSDTGLGIAPEFLPYVFDRFRQADSSSTRVYGGLGLGLSIVRHLVELHGGQVTAASDGVGKGSTFRVELPVRATTTVFVSPPAVQRDAIPPPEAQVRLDGVRVLVVDDEPDTLTAMAAILDFAGAEVRTSLSVAQALVTLESWKPNLLVSDLGMSDEDGYSLIRKVRSLPPERGGRVPAVAVTAYTRPEDRMKVLASGFQSHIPKPIEPVDLIAMVADLGRAPVPIGY